MLNKKVLIICQSIHHGNTMKVAKVMAKELDADIRKPSEIKVDDIDKYDLIGFGSGIYNGKHHISLFNLIKKIKTQTNKKTFIFSTATTDTFRNKMHESLRCELINKGFSIVDEFICKGFMDYIFIKYFFGGLNKKRPNENDLKKAKEFALRLKKL
jgi:flavodoxin